MQAGSRALLYMAGSAVCFATMNLLARLATTSTSWATVGAMRAVVGALVALAVARVRGVPLRVHDHRALLLRSAFGTLSMMATFYALSSRTLALGDTVTLLNLSPVFLALLAPVVLGERTAPTLALAIAVSLGGVVLILHPSFAWHAATGPDGGPSAAVTAGAAVTAALSTSIAMMMLRRAGRTESAEVIAIHFSVAAALLNAVVSLFDLRMPSARDAACGIGAGVAAGFGQLAMTRAYTLERAARVGGVSYLAVVVSAILGALVLDERPAPAALAGIALVVAGGILVTLARSPAPPSPAPGAPVSPGGDE